MVKNKTLGKRKAKNALTIILFMAFPVFLLLLFTYIPFAKMIQFSFYDMKYIGPKTFVGWDNYKEVFRNKELFGSLVVSLYYMGGGIVQLALSLLFATMFVFRVKGEGIFKAALFFPYLICGIAVGFIFKFFYFHGYVLDSILMLFGMKLEDLPLWLQNTHINNIALTATSVWRYTGQQTILFLGAMMSVDKDLYEAAALDGCNRFQLFKYIILPSIRSIIVLNIILCFSGCLSAFEPPYVITNGAFGTATYFVKMNSVAHETQKVGLASAMAIVLLILIILCTVAQKLFFKYGFKDGTEDDELTLAAKQRKKMERQKRKEERARRKAQRKEIAA